MRRQLRALILRRALRDFGWIEGNNITIEVRLAGGDVSRMRAE